VGSAFVDMWLRTPFHSGAVNVVAESSGKRPKNYSHLPRLSPIRLRRATVHGNLDTDQFRWSRIFLPSVFGRIWGSASNAALSVGASLFRLPLVALPPATSIADSVQAPRYVVLRWYLVSWRGFFGARSLIWCYHTKRVCLTRLGETVAKFRAFGPIIAAVRHGSGAFSEHAVESINEQIEGFVTIVTRDTGDEVRAADFNMTFGDKLSGVIVALLKRDANAHDSGLMS